MAVEAPALSPTSDEELVRLFQEAHEDQCFTQLFERYRKKVFFACRAFFEKSERAEDATQETFLKAYESITQFKQGNFSAWLMRICRNVCIDEWRRRRNEEMAVVEGLPAEELEGSATEPDSDLGWIGQKLRLEMNSLNVEQRHCLELKIAGYSYDEIAGLVRLPVKAVKSHLQNARRMLWIKMGPSLSQLK